MGKKKKLNIIVVEDNRIFNSILTRALNEHILRTASISSNYDIRLYSFINPDECLEALQDEVFTGSSLAFLDYYLGNNTNGSQILKTFKAKNKNIKFVVLSQSNMIANLLKTNGQLDASSHFLKKDIYAPDICCLLMEDFMQNQT